jgi:hypothetical protein
MRPPQSGFVQVGFGEIAIHLLEPSLWIVVGQHAEVYISRWFESVCSPPKPSFT